METAKIRKNETLLLLYFIILYIFEFLNNRRVVKQ